MRTNVVKWSTFLSMMKTSSDSDSDPVQVILRNCQIIDAVICALNLFAISRWNLKHYLRRLPALVLCSQTAILFRLSKMPVRLHNTIPAPCLGTPQSTPLILKTALVCAYCVTHLLWSSGRSFELPWVHSRYAIFLSSFTMDAASLLCCQSRIIHLQAKKFKCNSLQTL